MVHKTAWDTHQQWGSHATAPNSRHPRMGRRQENLLLLLSTSVSPHTAILRFVRVGLCVTFLDGVIFLSD